MLHHDQSGCACKGASKYNSAFIDNFHFLSSLHALFHISSVPLPCLALPLCHFSLYNIVKDESTWKICSHISYLDYLQPLWPRFVTFKCVISGAKPIPLTCCSDHVMLVLKIIAMAQVHPCIHNHFFCSRLQRLSQPSPPSLSSLASCYAQAHERRHSSLFSTFCHSMPTPGIASQNN